MVSFTNLLRIVLFWYSVYYVIIYNMIKYYIYNILIFIIYLNIFIDEIFKLTFKHVVEICTQLSSVLLLICEYKEGCLYTLSKHNDSRKSTQQRRKSVLTRIPSDNPLRCTRWLCKSKDSL